MGTRKKNAKDQSLHGSDIPDFDSTYFKQVIDMEGCMVVPGFVDMHVHVTGGGGMTTLT